MLHFEMIFLRVTHFTHKTLCTKFLHWVGWSGVTPDHPAKQCLSVLSKSGWSGLGPDDPGLGFCECLEGPGRMIRTWEIQVCFWPILSLPRMIRGYSGWSGNHQKTHNGHFRGWEYVYPFTPFIYFSLSLSLSLTNHASLAFIISLLSILELDSCKETPRDWEEVRFEVWFESTLWASTYSSQEAFEATLIHRFAFVTLGALLLDS